MRVPFLLLIRLYQKTLSPDHGFLKGRFQYGFCRFHPTCSQYAYEAIDEHGLLKGAVLGGYRILRCNPFGKGGVDPVPKK
ncbi:membrane protein insertion efficiency factor YidD [Patescibacteria group bacterium]|nr:membrane protein insertion efficiency factor YidD [Patescibacteria group bacterium]